MNDARYTVGELYDEIIGDSTAKAFLPSDFANVVPDYKSNFRLYDDRFLQRFEDFKVMVRLRKSDIKNGEVSKSVVYSRFNNSLSGFLKLMAPIWEELYRSINYDFNPLENYDRYEDATTTNKESGRTVDKSTFNKGAEKIDTAQDFGSRKNSTTRSGSDNATTTYGGVNETTQKNEMGNNNNVYGAKTSNDSETRKKAPFDSESFYNDENNIIDRTEGGHTDVLDTTINTEETKSVDSHIDTSNSTSSDTSTDTMDAYQDVTITSKEAYEDNTNKQTTTEGNGESTITSHIHGNIGVTTSSKMLEEFRILVDYNIIDKIFDDIRDYYLVAVW